MTDPSRYKEYHLTEKDIDKAIHILSVIDPENTNADNAIDFLIYLRQVVHDLADNSTPEELVSYYEAFTKQKR